MSINETQTMGENPKKSKKEGKVEKFNKLGKKTKEKIQSIAILFFVVVIGLTLIISAGFYYGIIGIGAKKIIIINPAEAKEAGEKEVVLETCNDYIAEYSKKFDVDQDLIERIVKAESGGNELAENGSSTATGCFQFINGTWRRYGKEYWGDDFYEKNIYDAKDNVELGMYVIEKYGTSDWNASKNNWDN